MHHSKKCIILNLDKSAQSVFSQGIHPVPCEFLHTTRISLHIRHNDSPIFMHHNTQVDWEDAYVFTRLHGKNQHFCGILYDYFNHHKIATNDPINASYKNSAGKISQMLKLALSGIRIPDTHIFGERAFKANHEYITTHLSYPLIYKTDGRRGAHVHYLEDEASLIAQLKEKPPYTLALVQPFISNTFDTRTIVAFGTVLGSIKRTRTHGFLNNISQGADASLYELTEEEKRVAIEAARVCGVDVAGVDMIHTDDGPLVLEVNKSPQVAGFESVHSVKVFAEIGALIKRGYFI